MAHFRENRRLKNEKNRNLLGNWVFVTINGTLYECLKYDLSWMNGKI